MRVGIWSVFVEVVLNELGWRGIETLKVSGTFAGGRWARR